MRVMDGLMAIPAILLAIALVSLNKASVGIVIVAISIPEIPRVVRLVRAVVLTVRERPYIEAARLRRRARAQDHLAPHPAEHGAAADRAGTYVIASAILTEAGLSLPRRRRAAGHPDLGQHDRQLAPLHRPRAVDGVRARRRAGRC